MFGQNQNKPQFSFSITSTPGSNTQQPSQPAQTSTPFNFGGSSNTIAQQPQQSNLLGSSFSFGGGGAPKTSASSTNLFGAPSTSALGGLSAGGNINTVKSSSTNLFGSAAVATPTASTTSSVPGQSINQSSSLFSFNTAPTTAATNQTPAPSTNSFFSGSLGGGGGQTSAFGSTSSALGGTLGGSASQTQLSNQNKTVTPSFSFNSQIQQQPTQQAPATNLFGQSTTATAPLTGTSSTSGFNIGQSTTGSTFNFNQPTAATATSAAPIQSSVNQSNDLSGSTTSKSLFGSTISAASTSTTVGTVKPTFGFNATSTTPGVAPQQQQQQQTLATGTYNVDQQKTTGLSFNAASSLGGLGSIGGLVGSLGGLGGTTTGSATNLSTLVNLPQSSTKNSLASLTNSASLTGLNFSSNNSTAPTASKTTTTPLTNTAANLSFPTSIKTQPATTTATTTTTATAELKPKATTNEQSSLDTSRTQTLVNAEASLPTVSSFTVPGLTSNKTADAFKSSVSNGANSLPGQSAAGASNAQGQSNINDPNNVNGSIIIRSQSIKDQLLPQALLEAVENFKKNMEETRKLKELNSAFNSRTLNQNIHEIITVKQRLAQTNIELQQNCNEASKLKEHIKKELRHVDICENLKSMPLGLQYDTEIWNEYFLTRVHQFQSKLRMFKIQFEQLEGYFKVHDRENKFDSQKIVETLKVIHRNLLNEAANLKLIHEQVEGLKKSYLTYKRNLNGDTTNIFEIDENTENIRP